MASATSEPKDVATSLFAMRRARLKRPDVLVSVPTPLAESHEFHLLAETSSYGIRDEAFGVYRDAVVALVL